MNPDDVDDPDGTDPGPVEWSCRVEAGGWVLEAAAVDDPFAHRARAVQQRYGGRVDQWEVRYYRGDELVSDGSISVPPPYTPPIATVVVTLASLRREAAWWETHPTAPR